MIPDPEGGYTAGRARSLSPPRPGPLPPTSRDEDIAHRGKQKPDRFLSRRKVPLRVSAEGTRWKMSAAASRYLATKHIKFRNRRQET